MVRRCTYPIHRPTIRTHTSLFWLKKRDSYGHTYPAHRAADLCLNVDDYIFTSAWAPLQHISRLFTCEDNLLTLFAVVTENFLVVMPITRCCSEWCIIWSCSMHCWSKIVIFVQSIRDWLSYLAFIDTIVMHLSSLMISCYEIRSVRDEKQRLCTRLQKCCSDSRSKAFPENLTQL